VSSSSDEITKANEPDDHAGRQRRPVTLRRRFAFSLIATLIGVGILAGLDHSVCYFFYQQPTTSLLFPSGSLVAHDSSEFSVTVKISDAGIRDRHYQAGTPKEGTTRIVAVGDSFTFGWGVENDQAWPNVLERQLLATQSSSKLNVIEVLNFGYPGASPIGYEQSVAQAIKHFQPQVVVLGILQGDDLIQIHDHKKNPKRWSWKQLPKATFPSVNRFLRGQPNPDPMRSYHETFYLSNQYIRSQFNYSEKLRYQSLSSGVRQAFESGLLNPSLVQTSMNRPKYFSEPLNADAAWRATVSERLDEVLVRTHQQCRVAGCQLVVAIVPNGPYVSRVVEWNARGWISGRRESADQRSHQSVGETYLYSKRNHLHRRRKRISPTGI